MTAVSGPTSVPTPLLALPSAAPGLAPLAAPLIAFRSVLFEKQAAGLRWSAESLKSCSAEPRAALKQGTSGIAAHAVAKDAAPGSPSRRDQLLDDDLLQARRRHSEAFSASGVVPVAPCISPDLVAMTAPPGAAASNARAVTSLEDLLPTLVRRIAWSGDRNRGTVRLELGAGELAGSTLLVHAEAGRVSVHLSAPPGVDTSRWQERIRQRLESRGVKADAVEVT